MCLPQMKDDPVEFEVLNVTAYLGLGCVLSPRGYLLGMEIFHTIPALSREDW